MRAEAVRSGCCPRQTRHYDSAATLPCENKIFRVFLPSLHTKGSGEQLGIGRCRRRGGMVTSRFSSHQPHPLPERAPGELVTRHQSLPASQQGRISEMRERADFHARPAAASFGGDSRRITAMPAGVSAYTAARCECAPPRAPLCYFTESPAAAGAACPRLTCRLVCQKRM